METTGVDLITDRNMQYIYTLQGDPEQIIAKLNDRSHTMEQAVKGNMSSLTSHHVQCRWVVILCFMIRSFIYPNI